ncbi:universal stress protein [Haloechinothrix sp. LS1_15]|uniref:universal stress protein n=1 Tax=Haloechinothrix sp. LS1_15 TaxID=2652248 RepID=UPI002947943E|nr:universal stress protein [Haloechinothrix sp. LS1_15]MDV6014265.1 universal stress protein [Haloechinothrix sp. LS1_15]
MSTVRAAQPGVPRHILAASDLSAHGARAVRRGVQLAREHGAELSVLHVSCPRAESMPRGQAEARLGAQLPPEAAGDSNVKVMVRWRDSSRSRAIASVARERDADLIVLGVRPGPGQPVGNTPKGVTAAGGIPVLLVRDEPRHEYATVLLAVDRSPDCVYAAQFGLSLTPGASHIVGHAVVIVGEQLLRLRSVEGTELDSLRASAAANERPRIEAIARRLRPQPERIVLEPGHPRDAVPRLCRRYGADLVVVGKGTGGVMERAILGSVSAFLIRWAPSDVLVVPGERTS